MRTSSPFFCLPLFLVTLFVSLGTVHVHAMPVHGAECARLLTDASTTRYFRGADDFQETSHGMYLTLDGQLYFVPDDSFDGALIPVNSPMGSAASHFEILRKQLGARRMNDIMASQNPQEALSEALMEEVAKTQPLPLNLDAEEIFEEVNQIPAKEPLPKDLEEKVLGFLRQTGRLASPLSEWLEPIVTQNRLTQLPVHLMQDPIEKRASKSVFVYKAMFAKVLLSDEKELVLSSGRNGLPDSVHSLVMAALTMVVPKSRIITSFPGYLLIKKASPDQSLTGTIEFVNKAQKQTLFSERYRFTAP